MDSGIAELADLGAAAVAVLEPVAEGAETAGTVACTTDSHSSTIGNSF